MSYSTRGLFKEKLFLKGVSKPPLGGRTKPIGNPGLNKQTKFLTLSRAAVLQ
jgi:hypothetical protein